MNDSRINMSVTWPTAVEINNWDGSELNQEDSSVLCAVITRLDQNESQFVAYVVDVVSDSAKFIVWGSYLNEYHLFENIMNSRGIPITMAVNPSTFTTGTDPGEITQPPNTIPPGFQAVTFGGESLMPRKLAA